jgi:hypothetical protein
MDCALVPRPDETSRRIGRDPFNRVRWVEDGHVTDIGIAHEGIKPNSFGHSIDRFDSDSNNLELGSEA